MAQIKLDKSKCIGCGTCSILCEEFFTMGEDGKSHLKEAIESSNGVEQINVQEVSCAQEAAQSCPMQCITIIQ